MTEVEKRAWRLASEEKARALKEAREAAEIELEKAMAAAKKAQVTTGGPYKRCDDCVTICCFKI